VSWLTSATNPLTLGARHAGRRRLAFDPCLLTFDFTARDAWVDGAVASARCGGSRAPLIMTVATTVLGLLPPLWEAGLAQMSARTAAPVVGGLWLCMLLTLLVLPAAYAMWRRHEVRGDGRLSAARCVGGCNRSSRMNAISPGPHDHHHAMPHAVLNREAAVANKRC
jgi:hypothetical protein